MAEAFATESRATCLTCGPIIKRTAHVRSLRRPLGRDFRPLGRRQDDGGRGSFTPSARGWWPAFRPRPVRPGRTKQDGRDYHFLSPEEFARRREAGEFLECCEVFGRGYWYGTLKSEVTPRLAAGKWVVLEIDVQGTLAVLEQYPDALTIFIRPESLEELERRLRGRGTESEEAVSPPLGSRPPRNGDRRPLPASGGQSLGGRDGARDLRNLESRRCGGLDMNSSTSAALSKTQLWQFRGTRMPPLPDQPQEIKPHAR